MEALIGIGVATSAASTGVGIFGASKAAKAAEKQAAIAKAARVEKYAWVLRAEREKIAEVMDETFGLISRQSVASAASGTDQLVSTGGMRASAMKEARRAISNIRFSTEQERMELGLLPGEWERTHEARWTPTLNMFGEPLLNVYGENTGTNAVSKPYGSVAQKYTPVRFSYEQQWHQAVQGVLDSSPVELGYGAGGYRAKGFG